MPRKLSFVAARYRRRVNSSPEKKLIDLILNSNASFSDCKSLLLELGWKSGMHWLKSDLTGSLIIPPWSHDKFETSEVRGKHGWQFVTLKDSAIEGLDYFRDAADVVKYLRTYGATECTDRENFSLLSRRSARSRIPAATTICSPGSVSVPTSSKRGRPMPRQVWSPDFVAVGEYDSDGESIHTPIFGAAKRRSVTSAIEEESTQYSISTTQLHPIEPRDLSESIEEAGPTQELHSSTLTETSGRIAAGLPTSVPTGAVVVSSARVAASSSEELQLQRDHLHFIAQHCDDPHMKEAAWKTIYRLAGLS